MKVFVTVGTTKFDALIKKIFSHDVQDALTEKQYTNLTVQIGNSQEPGTDLLDSQTTIDEVYKFKPSLDSDIKSADLVIAHAGAGTCLEVLESNKPLIVVINEELMGNHQTELAERLEKDNHLVRCTCSTLANAIREFDLTLLVPYEKGNIEIFANFIEDLMKKN